MYAPHTVTLYNVTEDSSGSPVINKTELRGVLLSMTQESVPSANGNTDKDTAKLFIPSDVRAFNANTGEEQAYMSPKLYDLQSNKSSVWTIRPGGTRSSTDCFFAKGAVVTFGTFQQVNAANDYVFRANSVSWKDYGSAGMQHWEVGGR